MNERPEVRDLHNIYGFERLYQTLIADGGNGRRTSDVLYGCYLANIKAFNERYGENLEPLEPEIFFYRMATSRQQPYKTEIQTLKVLTLLEWNMHEGEAFSESVRQLCETKSDLAHRFHAETGYSYSDPVTSYSLCEESLNPEFEPDSLVNPYALARKHNTGSKLVYICAPLRGDTEKNIEFARQRAKEVFLEGNIPVCPHLMFPPIADPSDPVQDGAAMRMCKKLIDRCDEVRVYGPEWTAGMWDEIRYAGKMKVPVMTDQTEIPKPKHRNSPCR